MELAYHDRRYVTFRIVDNAKRAKTVGGEALDFDSGFCLEPCANQSKVSD